MRNVEYRDPQEAQWEEFQRSIQKETEVDSLAS